jgi:alcohol dehydrogenase
MDISFKFEPEITIGADTISLAGSICGRYGERIMIAADHDIDPQLVGRLKEILEDSRIEAIVFDGITEDSSADMAENVVQLANPGHCNAIIGLGGPKAQLIARMAAIMAPSKMSVFDLLEGRDCQGKFLPFISIPTVSLDPFALTEYFVVVDPRDRTVKSVTSPGDLYAAMLIDSSLLQFLSTPAAPPVIFEGFLAATEAYCSSKSNFLSEALLERALSFYARLMKSGSGGMDAGVYAQAIFLTALGTAASSPGLGAALNVAVNARYPDVKQACSAALLPVIAKRLVSARPEKMARVASFLANTGTATVADAANAAVDSIKRSMEAMNVQASLKEFNISLDKVTAAAEAARGLEFVPNSPWTVSEEDVFEILKEII